MGHVFADRELLAAALTHPSALEDLDLELSYERLEFLGDSVVGLIVAEEAFNRYHDIDEGGLTRIKIALVSGTSLACVAEELGLAECIIFGSSEAGTGRRGLHSALENVYEAITAAVYLDGGLPAARTWVLDTLGPHLSEEHAFSPENPKSTLQELLQAHGTAPTYTIVAEDGPPHDRTFYAQARIGGAVLGSGNGRSKKEAEAAAALEAVDVVRAALDDGVDLGDLGRTAQEEEEGRS